MVLYKYGFRAVAASFHLVDVHIAMVLAGDITIGYVQDAMEQANVPSVMAQVDTMKSNTDKEIKEYKNKEEI